MEVAFAFGSLGDIIAVCQLAIKFGRALGVGACNASSSAEEYQDLRSDLEIFIKILMQVIATYEQYESSLYLNNLDNVAKSVVDQCGRLIQEALNYLQPKYHDSLQVGGSGRKGKDVFRKIEWAFREKDRLKTLRDGLREGVVRLTLLTTLTTQKSNRVGNATLRSRVEEVYQLVSQDVSQARKDKQEMLELLRKQDNDNKLQGGRLEVISAQIDTHTQSHWQILQSVKGGFSAILEVKQLLIQVAQGVTDIQALLSNSIYIQPLDPTKEQPVVFTCSFGGDFTIPAELIKVMSWETLASLLDDHIGGSTDPFVILGKCYILTENHSNIICPRQPLSWTLRRGMRVNVNITSKTYLSVSPMQSRGGVIAQGMPFDQIKQAYAKFLRKDVNSTSFELSGTLAVFIKKG